MKKTEWKRVPDRLAPTHHSQICLACLLVCLFFFSCRKNNQPKQREKPPRKEIGPTQKVARKQESRLLRYTRQGAELARFFWSALQAKKVLGKEDLLAIEALFKRYEIAREHTQVLVDLRAGYRLLFDSSHETSEGFSRLIAAWERAKVQQRKQKGYQRFFWDQILIKVGIVLRRAIHEKRGNEYRGTLVDVDRVLLGLARWWGSQRIRLRVDKSQLRTVIIELKTVFTHHLISLRQSNSFLGQKKSWKYRVKMRGGGRIGAALKIGMGALALYNAYQKVIKHNREQYRLAKHARKKLLTMLQKSYGARYSFSFWPSGVLKTQYQHTKQKREGWYRSWYRNTKPHRLGIFKQGRKHGVWKGWYPNGDLLFTGRYILGLREGAWRSFYKGRRPKSVLLYRKGKFHGKQEYWYATGKRKQVLSFFHGKKHGVFKWMNPAEGRLLEKKQYHQGQMLLHKSVYSLAKPLQKHFEKRWYRNGKRKSVKYTQAGSKRGVWKRWYSNGVLQWRGSYEDGAKHGEFRRHYQAGGLHWRRWYRWGLPDKTWVRYAPNDRLVERKTFVKGKREGSSFFFDPFTRMVWRENHASGRKHGRFSWEMDKLLLREEVYENGRLLARIVYDHKKDVVETKLFVLWGNGQRLVRQWRVQRSLAKEATSQPSSFPSYPLKRANTPRR